MAVITPVVILVPPDWIPILNPPVAVIIPLVLILAVVDNPRAVVAVVAVPWKDGAVTVFVNLPVPFTCKFAVGLSVPIPSNFEAALKTI